MIPAILAVAIGYLTGSAIITFGTVDQPRRAFPLHLSITLGLLRAALAFALLAVLLAVTA